MFLRYSASKNGVPDGENRIILRLLVLSYYQRVTDGRTDGHAVVSLTFLHKTHYLKFICWLAINERIEYINLFLTYI